MNTATKLPIMQRALGTAWDRLGEIVRRHYAVIPGTTEAVAMNGIMSISYSPAAYPFLLAGRLIGALVAKRGNDVPVCVRNWCRTDSPAMHWHRSFHFCGSEPLIFASRMEYAGGDEIVEYVRFNLGVRMRLSEQDGALVFTSRGYQWDLGPFCLRLPDWLFLGQAEIRETPTADGKFRVDFTMRHPLFGKSFGYRGEFMLAVAEHETRDG